MSREGSCTSPAVNIASTRQRRYRDTELVARIDRALAATSQVGSRPTSHRRWRWPRSATTNSSPATKASGSTTPTSTSTGACFDRELRLSRAPTAAGGTTVPSPSARAAGRRTWSHAGVRRGHDPSAIPCTKDRRPTASTTQPGPHPVVTVELEEQEGLRFTSTVVGAPNETRHRRAGRARLDRARRTRLSRVPARAGATAMISPPATRTRTRSRSRPRQPPASPATAAR